MYFKFILFLSCSQNQPSKRQSTGPPAFQPIAPKKARVSTPKRTASETASPAQSPSTPTTPTVPPLKLSLKSIRVKHRTVHKRVQVDEQQEEALESEDESAEGKEKSKFKVAADRKNFRQSGTQVNEADLSGCCWVCRQMKIKMEIKQEMEDDTGGIKVKQEPLPVKQEPGEPHHGEPHHPGDSLHDVLSSPPGASTSKSPSKSGDLAYLQKKVEILSRERNNLRNEVDKLKDEQSKQNGELSLSDLQDQLEDSWQKNEDLQKKMKTVEADRDMLKQELELSRSKNVNEALSKTAAQLRTVTEERDMMKVGKQDFENRIRTITEERDLLRTGKKDLENRVQSFTKTLSERLNAQEKKFNSDLREAQDRATLRETEACSLKKEKETLTADVERLKRFLSQEEEKHNATLEKQRIAQEKSKKDLEECKMKVQAVLESQCQQFQEKENDLRGKLAAAHRAKGELLQKFKEYEEQIAKVDDLNKKQEELREELVKAKEKERKAVKILEDSKVKHGNQLKQLEEQGIKRLEECRKEFQVRRHRGVFKRLLLDCVHLSAQQG